MPHNVHLLSAEQVKVLQRYRGLLLGNLWLTVYVIYTRCVYSCPRFLVSRRCPRSCPMWPACRPTTSPTSCARGRRLCECRYRGSRPSQVCDPCVLDSLTLNIGRSNLMCISCVDYLIDKILLLYVHHHPIVSQFHIFTCHLYAVRCWPSYSITECTNCLSIIFYKPMVIYTEGRIEGRL